MCIRDSEGDFVRLSSTPLYLPQYAAMPPRARYARAYRGPWLDHAGRPMRSIKPARLDVAINHYLHELGSDPVLPFVVPTRWKGSDTPADDAPMFFVPARYSGLLDNARLVAGNLTVVGKVIYLDNRLANDPQCAPKAAGREERCIYVDRQTIATFAPALGRAPEAVLRLLHMKSGDVTADVAASVRFRPPIVVILPLAIYQ